MILDNWAEAVSKTFQASYEVVSKITSDPNILGDSREAFVRDVLSKFLPQTLVVGTGRIQNSEGKQSNQIDVILYRSDFPILTTFGGSNIYLLEGVVASLEVKSRLNPDKIGEAIQNCRSVRKLQISQDRSKLDEFCWRMLGKPYGGLDNEEQALIRRRFVPPTYIFGYRGYSNRLRDFANILKAKLPELKEGTERCERFDLLPDIVCAEGCIAAVADGSFFTHQRSCSLVAKREANPLRLLLAHLVRAVIASLGEPTHQKSGLTFDLSPYLSPAHLDDSWQQLLSISLTPLENRWVRRAYAKGVTDVVDSSETLTWVSDSESIGGGHLRVSEGNSLTFDFSHIERDTYTLTVLAPTSWRGEFQINFDGQEVARLNLHEPPRWKNAMVSSNPFRIDISGFHKMTLTAIDHSCGFQMLRLENVEPRFRGPIGDQPANLAHHTP